jgi:hypothetical protein
VPGAENTLTRPARVRRAADDLHRCAAVAGLHHADPQAIRVGVLLGGDHARDRERRKQLRLVLDVFNLKPDHGELVGERLKRLVGVEMFLQPGEGEFHGLISAHSEKNIHVSHTLQSAASGHNVIYEGYD